MRFGSMAEASLDENGHVGREKRIKHYSNLHRILLVGEGDFSFAACLARTFGAAINMVATSLDSRDKIKMSYATSATINLEVIELFGGTVLHEVDAHTMSKHPILKHKSFDRIVYNFPHAGCRGRETSLLQIELHRDLVRGFLKNAKAMLTEDGEIHVTLKTTNPYRKWGIEKLAEEQGLFSVKKVRFSVSDYGGYINRRGSSAKPRRTFPIGEASTYKFSKNRTSRPALMEAQKLMDMKRKLMDTKRQLELELVQLNLQLANLETSPKEGQAEKSVIKGLRPVNWPRNQACSWSRKRGSPHGIMEGMSIGEAQPQNLVVLSQSEKPLLTSSAKTVRFTKQYEP